MIHPVSLTKTRFQGLKLQKNGCNWLGEYTPRGNRVSLNDNVIGDLKNPGVDFKRFLTYFQNSQSLSKPKASQAMQDMRQHLQRRLAEVDKLKKLPDFLHNLALFETYAPYVQNIQVFPESQKVTFRLGYPNCAVPSGAFNRSLAQSKA